MDKITEAIKSGRTYVGAFLGAAVAIAAMFGVQVDGCPQGEIPSASAPVTE